MRVIHIDPTEDEIFHDYKIIINPESINDVFFKLDTKNIIRMGRENLIPQFIPLIKNNWNLLKSNEEVFQIVTCQHKTENKWAIEVFWKTTQNGYVLQCLASNDPVATNVVIKFVLRQIRGSASQAWYLPDDLQNNGEKYSRYLHEHTGPKVVEKMHKTVCKSSCDTFAFSYFFAKEEQTQVEDNQVSVHCIKISDQNELFDFACEHESVVFARNEELDQTDLFLEELDELYSTVGFSRNRRIFFANHPKYSTPLGILIQYSGPFGASLRWLEHKNQLTLRKDLPDWLAKSTTGKLLKAVSQSYESFLPGFIPVVTRGEGAIALRQLGTAVHLDKYYQHAVTPKGVDAIDFHLNDMKEREERIKRVHKWKNRRAK